MSVILRAAKNLYSSVASPWNDNFFNIFKNLEPKTFPVDGQASSYCSKIDLKMFLIPD